WALDAILLRFAVCCRSLSRALSEWVVRGFMVTTFGVVGALVDAKGMLLYPVISRKCPRTAALRETIERFISPRNLQTLSG
ncbi:FGGY family carbohydrate kinase, partial [Salmonella enterica]|uniref:FGGY family carbohydrate kinase n=1 Tax=Salmonella enterica TaxID=28901 RepID=UPI000BD816B5